MLRDCVVFPAVIVPLAGAGAGAGAGADAATVAGERIFASKSCPICLEDYIINDEQHAQRPNKLGCGTAFVMMPQ